MTKASKEQLQTICLFLFINKIKNIKKTKKTKQNKKRKAVNVTTEIGLLYSIHISNIVDQKMKILCLFLWGIFVQLK